MEELDKYKSTYKTFKFELCQNGLETIKST